MKRNFPNGDYHCGYEAGFSGFCLHESLWEAHINCIVINPADIPTTHKESEFKTDKNDALKIAKALRSGDLNPIAIPDKQLQEDRSLVRYRIQLRKDIVRQKCRIKSLLAFYNVQIPEQWSASRWSRPFVNWLWNLELTTDEGTKTLRLLMGMFSYIHGMCVNTDNHLRELSRTKRHEKQSKHYLRLSSDLERVRSIEFLVQIGDIKRFKNNDKLANYLGLVPSSNSSGESIKQDRLTYRGHKQLRSIMVEAAWTSISTDPAMAKKYSNLKKRMIAQRAIISVARSLLCRVTICIDQRSPLSKGYRGLKPPLREEHIIVLLQPKTGLPRLVCVPSYFFFNRLLRAVGFIADRQKENKVKVMILNCFKPDSQI